MFPLEIPIFPADTPWWALVGGWVLIGLVTAAVPVAVILVTRGNTKREVTEVHEKLSKMDEQVSNNHETNMREDIDEAKDAAARAERHALNADTNSKLANETAGRVERLFEDLIKSMRAVEHSLDRRDKLHLAAITELREDFDAHLDDIPRILDDAFVAHANDCLVRSPERRPDVD